MGRATEGACGGSGGPNAGRVGGTTPQAPFGVLQNWEEYSKRSRDEAERTGVPLLSGLTREPAGPGASREFLSGEQGHAAGVSGLADRVCHGCAGDGGGRAEFQQAEFRVG